MAELWEAAMESLLSHPYRGMVDLRAVIDLICTCRAVEDIDPWPPIDEVRHNLCARDQDLAANTQVWERRTGGLAAVALIWDGEALISCLHPQDLSEQLAAQILTWGMARACDLARRHGERATLLTPIRADDDHAAALLERHGFIAENWSVLRMARSLVEPIPVPQLPAGFMLRPVTNEEELAAAAALYQVVFVARSSIVQDRLELNRATDGIRALDLVAVAPDGTFAAFCLCLAGLYGGAPRPSWPTLPKRTSSSRRRRCVRPGWMSPSR